MEAKPTYRIVCSPFSSLSGRDVYKLLELRQDVFVVEQKCIYQDIDDCDDKATHLLAWNDDTGALAGCARLFAPGVKYDEAAFGRVATASHARRTGLGRHLVATSMAQIAARFGSGPVRINAQSYLRRFYEEFGFEVTRGPYDEDGIAHFEMLARVLPSSLA